METLYAIAIMIGFYSGLAALVWFIKWIGELLETRKYKFKLKHLAPQIALIDINELSSKLTKIKENNLALTKLIQQKYGIRENNAHVKTVNQYIQEEATYRRSKRKPAKRTYRRKYRRHY